MDNGVPQGRARAASARIWLVAAGAEALPFRENAFDTAIVGLALCTIPRPRRALAELRRALRSGASLRLLEHVRVAQPDVARLEDWLTPFWRRVAGGCRLNRRTTDVIAASGFVIESTTPHAGGLVVEIVASTRRDDAGPPATAGVYAFYPPSYLRMLSHFVAAFDDVIETCSASGGRRGAADAIPGMKAGSVSRDARVSRSFQSE